jgi:hypothetical protein
MPKKDSEYLRLRKIWYAKAAESGFEELEVIDPNSARIGGEIDTRTLRATESSRSDGRPDKFGTMKTVGWLRHTASNPRRDKILRAWLSSDGQSTAAFYEALREWYWYIKHTEGFRHPDHDTAMWEYSEGKSLAQVEFLRYNVKTMQNWLYSQVKRMKRYLQEHGDIPYVDPPAAPTTEA